MTTSIRTGLGLLVALLVLAVSSSQLIAQTPQSDVITGPVVAYEEVAYKEVEVTAMNINVLRIGGVNVWWFIVFWLSSTSTLVYHARRK